MSTLTQDKQTETIQVTPVKSHKSPRMLIIGIVVLAFAAFAGYWAYVTVSGTTEVLAVTSTVTRGDVIERDDLGVTNLPADSGLDLVLVSDLDKVVGARAAWDMPAGSPVVASAIVDETGPIIGRAWIGATLSPNQFPADAVPGSPVVLVSTPAEGDEASAADSALTIPATIVSRSIDEMTGESSLMFDVAKSQAADAAGLVATGRIGVVVVSAGKQE